MDKDLELYRKLCRFFDLLAAHFAREHHALEAHFAERLHAGSGVHAHLCGRMQRQLGCDLPRQPRNAHILYDQRVGVRFGCCADRCRQRLEFLVKHQRIEGDIHLDAVNMAVGDRVPQLFI